MMNLLLFILTMSLLLAGCGSNAPGSAGPSPRLVVFGDSLSWAKNTWPWMVAEELGLQVENQASPGTVIENDEQIGRIRRMIFLKTDTVVYLTGYNNMRGFGPYTGPVAHYKAYLKEALEIFKASGVKVYIGTTLSALCDSPEAVAANKEGCTSISGVIAGTIYGEAVRDVVAEVGGDNIHLVDTNAQYTPSSEKYVDYVHLTEFGYKEIASIFLQEMESK